MTCLKTNKQNSALLNVFVYLEKVSDFSAQFSFQHTWLNHPPTVGDL